jgi:S-adenosylmethionine:tRNA ribosyltransferase-isomerase
MTPARTYPARRDDVRLLLVDPAAPALAESRTSALVELLAPGDLLVVNDAATLPASLLGRDEENDRPVEARLVSAMAGDGPQGTRLVPAAGDGAAGAHFWAALLGAGDWRQRTEDRSPPPPLAPGARLSFGSLRARIVARSPLSPRLVALRFAVAGDGAAGPTALRTDMDSIWAAIYREGRPVQYSYLAHPLPLWAVQTVYAARPWAFEMPSAGRPLSWEILLGLRGRGVAWASLTHAAGLSATGDPDIDAALPLPERFDIPATTVQAIGETRRRRGRVIAVGTTVVRALEGAAAQNGGQLRAGAGVTDLKIGLGGDPVDRALVVPRADRRRAAGSAAGDLRVVDGILSGIHAAGESHFALLGAFAGAELLAAAAAHAEASDFTSHELGDAMLVLPGVLRR